MSEDRMVSAATFQACHILHLEVLGGPVHNHPGRRDGNQGEPSHLTPEKELEDVLNEQSNSVRRYDLSGNLHTPSEERLPDLRLWNMYAQREPLTRRASEADLQRFLKSGTIVQVKDLFSSAARFVAVLGGPGSGKTKFLRRYRDKVLKREVEGMRCISIVYLIDACRLAQGERKTTFWDFLFCKFTSSDISSEAKQWMKNPKNQHRILILIDGLQDFRSDDFAWQQPAIGYEDEALPSAFLSGLLQGELLPGARILATSRSYGIQNYHHRMRPQSTIKLAGYNKENTEYLFKEFVGPEVAKRWDTFSDSLKSLCSNPLYLVYVAYMQRYKLDSNRYMDSVSSIMMCIIQNLCNKNDWEKDSEPFKDLRSFCLQKSTIGQVVFSYSEIPRSLTSEERGLGLLFAVPKGMSGVAEQSRNRSFVYFRDLLIQQSLASLGFLDLPLAEYSNILKCNVTRDFFQTIQILACGILQMEGQQFEDLLDIADKNEKKKLLLDALKLPDSAGLGPRDMLHHLECLHEISVECDADIFPEEIDLSMQDLTRCTTHIIAPPIARCKNLVKLILHCCAIDRNKVKILWKSLRDSSVKIQHFDIGSNHGIGRSGLKTVAKIVRHCEVLCLVLDENRLTSEHMNEFFAEIKRYGANEIKLVRLFLRQNPEIGVDGLEATARTVDVAKIQVLDVSYCDVSPEAIKRMMGYNLGSLQELRLSGNVESMTQLKVVGECVARHSIEELHIDRCGLKPCHILDMEKSFWGSSINMKILNLNGNDLGSSSQCIQALCRLAKLGVRIDVDDCGFSDEVKDSLCNHAAEISEMNTHRYPKRRKRS